MPFRPVQFAPVGPSDNAEARFHAALTAGDGVFLPGDFNGDGQTDYIVASPEYGCPAEGMPYSSAGAVNDFILSTSAGYIVNRGFTGWLFKTRTRRVGHRDMIAFSTLYHGKCRKIATTLLGLDDRLFNVTEYRDTKGRKVDRNGCAEVTAVTDKPT